MKSLIYFSVLLMIAAHSFAGGEAITLATEEVASGLSSPVLAISPPFDDRLFIVEQNSGRIKILKSGSVLATPFLDIGSEIVSSGERGLLGLAFHPQYSNNGYFSLIITVPATALP